MSAIVNSVLNPSFVNSLKRLSWSDTSILTTAIPNKIARDDIIEENDKWMIK